MNKASYTILIGLIGGTVASSCLAEPLSYSPDRWPARWSAIVQQNQAPTEQSAYGYGYQKQTVRQENPWAHDGSTLFKLPANQRPWGQPPRKSRRERRAVYYRDSGQVSNRSNYRYMQSPYMGGMSSMYPVSGFAYGYPVGGSGRSYLYGGSPLLAPPLASYPYGAYPYVGYPPGLAGMNWPFGGW